LNIEYNHALVKTNFSKSEFMAVIKPFLKNLKTYLAANGKEDRVEKFQKGAQDFIKLVVADFDNWELYVFFIVKFIWNFLKNKFFFYLLFFSYTGASEKLDGSIVMSYWFDESASGPVFCLFNDSMKEIKC
jgi:hypothetical protein